MYRNKSVEQLQEQLASDERAFDLIWASKNGEILKWDAPSGGLTGKIDTTDGLASRIKAIKRELEVRKNAQRLCCG